MYKILVADDEKNIREVLREYAEFEGHEVKEAVDGMQAVEMAKNEDFDIIILDVMMPKLDGFSACKEIRKTKNTPVLMLSARGEEYDKLFGFEIGADDYVVKPFSPKEVLARVNAIIKRNGGNGTFTNEALTGPMNHYGTHVYYGFMTEVTMLLIENHFDVLGLVPQKLALDAYEHKVY